ncbi:MAG: DUF1559 domain-containing protein [Gemmata sp.]|nr:DUF1559 domain-containing protein [Gemmata sp.]
MRYPLRSAATSAGLAGLLLAAVVLIWPSPSSQILKAQADPSKVAPLPTAWRYVPHNAALFLHVEVATIWTSQLAQSFRKAEPKSFAPLEEFVRNTLGTTPDKIQTITLFIPQITANPAAPQLGLIVKFSQPFDSKTISAGLTELLGRDAKPKVHRIAENTALILIGLEEATYGQPQPADANGYLTAAIRAAAGGRHSLVVATAPSLLPDELQRDDLPEPLRPFQPLLRANSISATIDLNQALKLQVHVNTKRPAQAIEAEKALAALVEFLTQTLRHELADIEKQADNDAGLQDLLKVTQAAIQAAEKAQYQVDGQQVALTATLPLDGLPLASAYRAGVRQIEQTADIQRSGNNLKQIALAMHNYEAANDMFPPAAVCDKTGKPLLSWRVLILPYIDQEALFKEFKLDEPWDSEHNKKLLAKMPVVYRLPGAKPDAPTTHYRVFVGNGAGFDWVMGGKLTDITDGTSNTLMVVTAADAVPWTKPDELEYDKDKDMTRLIGAVVHGQVQIALFDGSVRTLKKVPAKEILHALITKSGGEVIPDDF